MTRPGPMPSREREAAWLPRCSGRTRTWSASRFPPSVSSSPPRSAKSPAQGFEAQHFLGPGKLEGDRQRLVGPDQIDRAAQLVRGDLAAFEIAVARRDQ